KQRELYSHTDHAIVKRMVTDSTARSLDTVFHALADPTRRAMLSHLARREASVSELARPFRTSLPGISKHLRVLEGAGLVKREKRGRLHLLRLQIEPMRQAGRWIQHYEDFWKQQLKSLDQYVRQMRRQNI